MTVVVRSKLTRVKCFSVPSAEKSATGTFITTFDDVIPGINQYTKEEFKRISKTDDFKAEVTAGNFEIIGGSINPTKRVKASETEQESGGDIKNLENFSIEEAIKIVKETENTKLLRGWQGEEMRAPVGAAITAKLKKIDDERKKAKTKANSLPTS